MNLNSHFAAVISEAFTHPFGAGHHHVDDVYFAVLVHMCASMCIAVLETEVIVNLSYWQGQSFQGVPTHPIGSNFSCHTLWHQKGK